MNIYGVDKVWEDILKNLVDKKTNTVNANDMIDIIRGMAESLNMAISAIENKQDKSDKPIIEHLESLHRYMGKIISRKLEVDNPEYFE